MSFKLIQMYECICEKCKYKWISRKPQKPLICPNLKCHSLYWNEKNNKTGMIVGIQNISNYNNSINDDEEIEEIELSKSEKRFYIESLKKKYPAGNISPCCGERGKIVYNDGDSKPYCDYCGKILLGIV